MHTKNVKYLPKSAMQKGLIIDAEAAKFLTETGVDVGIEKWKGIHKTYVSNERMVNGTAVRVEDNCAYLDAEYKKGVQIESFLSVDAELLPGEIDTRSKKEKVASYRYENADGQKFFVLAMDVEQNKNATYKRTYARQKQLLEAIEWIAGKKLPAVILKQPEVYVISKRKGKELFVAVLNAFADSICDEKVVLDKQYSKLRCLHGNVEYKNGEVYIKDLPAFSFVAFALTEAE